MKKLDLSWVAELTEPVLAALADALLEGACPQLTALSLKRSHSAAEASADPVARAITVGALPRLEELELWGCGMGAGVARGLVEAFKAGVAPELREALICSLRLEARMARALRVAIMEGCPRLRRHDLRIYN
jgi:hypothetical protein